MVINGLNSHQTKQIIELIINTGHSPDSFSFSPVDREVRMNKVTWDKIRIKKKDSNYYFLLIKISPKIHYRAEFIPGDNDDKPFYVHNAESFHILMSHFDTWLKILFNRVQDENDVINLLSKEGQSNILPENIIRDYWKNKLLNLPFNNSGFLIDKNENEILEFKGNFDWSNIKTKAKYLKTLVGFANNKGGCIVFGIKDTGEITGCDLKEFNLLDNSKIHDLAHAYFSQPITIGRILFELNNVELGAFYVSKSKIIPIECTKTLPYNNINEKKSETLFIKDLIYFRYNGVTDTITHSRLLKL